MRLPPAAAIDRLTRQHDLEGRAAELLLEYLREQMAAAQAVPDEATILIERVRDELGDWRICMLSPRGGPIHAPWAMAAAAKIRAQTGIDVETLWGDEGFVVRFPDVNQPPDPALLLPDPDEVHELVVRQLGGTALFAGKFRENAARSLLLPKHRPGMRAPLWQQRKRAADLLAVAARYGSFPVLLETYRECLRDFFDMPALIATLADVRSQKIRVTTVDSERPSPFAASLLFSYVASFIYDGDAPLAERRAQALVVDQAQLRELLGDAELRELLDAEAIEAVERQIQRLDPGYQAKSADGVHDMLLSLGDLTADELLAESLNIQAADAVPSLVSEGRILQIAIAGEARYIAVEDAARFRDALGVALPSGIPSPLLEPVRNPLGDLAFRFARTHAPFTSEMLAARYGLAPEAAEAVLARLAADDRLLEGEFRPEGTGREWTHPDVLRMIRRRSLARLRRQVEPVEQTVLARFGTAWQGIITPRRGPDALIDAIEQLQGAPLAASILETEILPARVVGYDPADLDALMAAGEVMWVGIEPIGDRNGRIALYMADRAERLLPPREVRLQPDRDTAILDALGSRGAMFFGTLHEALGGGYPGETVQALWRLVWRGLVTNDTFHALRAFTQPPPLRPRRTAPPSAEGRWAVVGRSKDLPYDKPRTGVGDKSHAGVGQVFGLRETLRPTAVALAKAVRPGKQGTGWAVAVAEQLLARYGLVTREGIGVEGVPGGFSTIYPVLKAMEEHGKIRRGYFVAGLGAAQFALPGALDLLRSLRAPDEPGEVVALAATDPANPYGATLKFSRGAARSVGSTVILVDGALVAYLARGDRQLLTWLPDAEPERSRASRAIARVLIQRAREGDEAPRGMLLEEIDGLPTAGHPISPFLLEAGFLDGAMGFAPSPNYVRSG